jgi:hypothetical protein
MWDKNATAEDATNQLRLLSRQRGGTAVGNLVCEQQHGIMCMPFNAAASIFVAGKQDFEAGDNRAEKACQIRMPFCRDQALTANAANSAAIR